MNLLDRFADFVVGRRLVALALVALVAGASLALVVSRGVGADFSPQALFTTFEDQQAIDAAFAATFGKTENVALVMVEAPDVLEPGVVAWMHDLALRLEDLEAAERVDAITTVSLPRSGEEGELRVDPAIRGGEVTDEGIEELRRGLDQARMLEGRLVSRSRTLAVIAVVLGTEWVSIDALAPAMDELHRIVDARPPPPGVRVDVAGIPAIRHYVVDQMIGDQIRLVPWAVVICMLLLLIAFRWLPGMIFPNVTVATTALVLVGGMALVGEKFNIINQMLPTLLIVIGIADSIHIVARYGEEYEACGDRLEACRRTVRSMTVACFLTTFTTAVGFATLVISRTSILRNFGVAAAIGLIAAYVITMLLLPPLLSFAGAPSQSLSHHRESRLEQWLEVIMVTCARHARKVLVASVLFLSGVVALASQVNIDTRLLETFPPETPIHRQVKTLERELDGVLPLEVHLVSTEPGRMADPVLLNRVDEIARWAREQDLVLSATSWSDLLHDTWVAYAGDASRRTQAFRSEAQVAQLASLLEGARPDPLTPWVTPDRREMRLNIQVKDIGSNASMTVAHELDQRMRDAMAEWPDVRVALTGDAWSGAIGLDSLIYDMLGSVGTAFVIIFAFLMVTFRSLRFGLISVPPNIIPLIATLAWMTFRDINLNTTTVIIFSVSIGLAVDDTVHVLTRFREEYLSGRSVERAIALAARGAGRAVVVTSFMLAGGLAVMLQSSFVPIRLFSELTAVTIVGCLFGDLIVLPAMLRLFVPELHPASTASAPHDAP